jgi:predicted peptidase
MRIEQKAGALIHILNSRTGHCVIHTVAVEMLARALPFCVTYFLHFAAQASNKLTRSEAVLLALIEHVSAEHAIDRDRVLVTGFSMGGRGTWHMAARHPEVFTGAIVMAGTPGASDIEGIVSMPVYLIHSPDDGVVPFAPVEEAYLTLAARGHAVEMSVLPGIDHYMMGAYVPALRAAGSWMLARWAAR